MITHKIEATFVLTVILILVAGHGEYYPVKCVQREMQALLKLKAELSDVDGLLSSWENGTNCCQWEGILCDNRTNHVFGLDLSGFQSLEGKTISESLVELDELTHLDLSFIYFKGAQIPEFVGSLGKLRYLNLSNCGLGGSVPHSLGNMSSLQFLDLSNNLHTDPYTSPINFEPPSSNLEWLSALQSLKYLDLSSLNLSEALTWPQQINNLPMLQQIHFHGCNLPFPSALPISSLNYLPNSSNSLLVLDLSMNFMIPSSVFPWLLTHKNTLSYLDLSENNIEGGIPDALKNFNNLSYLDLSSSNGLQGEILDALGNLPLSVSHLNLASSSLKGNIADTLPNLPPTVSYLDLSGNDLDVGIPNQRTLPPLLGQRYWSNLTFLDLSNNKLQGEFTHLVTLLWDYTFLQHLDLSGNNLFGSWPNMSRFQNLAHLDLEDNHLNGSIGEDYLRLPNLVYLDLAGNNLRGSIPNLSTCSSLRELRLNDGNKFSGKLTESIGSLGKLEYLDLESNHFEGLISDVHFLNLSNLQYLDLSFNSNLTIRMNPSWTPPFQLDYLALSGCTLGPQFPPWLRNQTQISVLDISHAGINDTIPNWFQNNRRLLREINMSYNQMHGPFPDFSSPINSLDLRFNEFNGTLPRIMMPLPLPNSTEIYIYLSNNKFSGNINNLVFSEYLGVVDLSNNQLSGQISQDCLDHLLNVSFVNLANNNLSGSFQTNITYCSITSLLLRNNRFTGNIPTSMAICSRLYVLDLSNNQLSGKISQFFWNFLMGVGFLNLANNNLSGNIRTNITGCGIRSLRLRSNSFVGQIPHSLAKCSDLFDLDIGENYINGRVPHWLGDSIPFLRLLSLRSNKLDGNLPSSLCKLSSIQLLDISRNNISGTIPKCVKNFTGMTSKSTTPDSVKNFTGMTLKSTTPNSVSNNSDAVSLINAKLIWKGHIVEYNTTIWLVKLLDLSENNLAGEIPHEVTSLVELVSLNLSSNHLVGSIPPNISNLKNLDSLDLSRNNLSGSIPSTLSQLHQLGNLNLSSNRLSGKIPYDAHMDTFSNSSYLENPRLCGPPLSKVCPEDVLRMRKPNFGDETVHEDMFKSREFYISMLLGFIMFFWAVFGSLYFNPWWNCAILKAFTAVDDWLYVKIGMNKRRVERYFQK